MSANKVSLDHSSFTGWGHVGYVLAAIALATVARFPMQPVMHNTSPFLFYLPVVVGVSILFGPKFGLLATVVSILPANYFWMTPERVFAVDFGEVCQILGFSFVGCSISWLTEAGRKRKQLEEHLRATLAGMGEAVVTVDSGGRIVYINTMAQVLTEWSGPDAVGCMVGSALQLLAVDDQRWLSASFQMALRDNEADRFPRRVIVVSKSGRQHRVEQKVSRILDAKGQSLGFAILMRPVEKDVAAPAQTTARDEDPLEARSPLPRLAMVSTHGYVASNPPLGAADTGGQVVYVLELAKKLAQLGHQVDIWTRQFEDQPQIEQVSQRVRIIRAPCGGRNFIAKERLCDSLPEWHRQALRFIQAHGLRYEYINSHYWDGGLAGQSLSKALGVPHVHTPHSLGIWKKRQTEADAPGETAELEETFNFARRIREEQSLYAAADVVVATTPEQLNLLLRDYEVTKPKCRMIPPGYDDTRFYAVSDATRTAIRGRLGFTSPVVEAVGRLADNKGYELLIKAFGVVTKRMPEAILQLAIGGATLTPNESSLFARLKTLVQELGLAENVRFRTFIPEDQLADYYRAADVFVLSSRYEPFGMTAVEAMACGAPTVLTVHGGLYQAVSFGQHGLYADPFDPEDLGMMIVKVLKHPRLRAQLSRMGAQRARSMFTWTGVAQQFAGLVTRHGSEHGTPSEVPARETWGGVD